MSLAYWFCVHTRLDLNSHVFGAETKIPSVCCVWKHVDRIKNYTFIGINGIFVSNSAHLECLISKHVRSLNSNKKKEFAMSWFSGRSKYQIQIRYEHKCKSDWRLFIHTKLIDWMTDMKCKALMKLTVNIELLYFEETKKNSFSLSLSSPFCSRIRVHCSNKQSQTGKECSKSSRLYWNIVIYWGCKWFWSINDYSMLLMASVFGKNSICRIAIFVCSCSVAAIANKCPMEEKHNGDHINQISTKIQ